MRRVYRSLLAGTLFIAMTAAAADSDSGSIAFENVTATALDRQASSDVRFDAVWTDFNSDGCPDPFVFGHADPSTSRLWLHRCNDIGGFELVANADVRYYINPPEVPLGAGWMSVLDIDGDGREDFWLRHANMMAARYLNGSKAGEFLPHFSGKSDACDDACVFGDIDGDGTLEIIHPDRRIVGILDGRQKFPAAGRRAEAIVADIDGDRWPDILQPGAGGYWRNDDGALTWVDANLSGDQPVIAADLDLDGDIDLVTVRTGDGGRVFLFRNEGDGSFTDVTARSGLQKLPVFEWWTEYGNRIAADLDNDGLPDLIMTSFERRRQVLLMRNLGALRFSALPVDLGPAGEGSEAYAARADLADFDRDGRLDLIKTQVGSNLAVWRNVTARAGHWQQVRVRGAARNSDGVGASLRWFAPATQRLIAHEIIQIGQNHPRKVAHAGLGRHDRADLEVRFPHDGPIYRFDGLTTDQAVIVFANGCLMEAWKPGAGWPLEPPATCHRHATPRTRATADHADDDTGRGAGSPLAAMLARLVQSAAVPGPEPAGTSALALQSHQTIELQRNGAVGTTVRTTFGIPFPPGVLTDVRLLHLVDERGQAVPARISPTLHWHAGDGSVRAVRVQLATDLDGDKRTLRFAIGGVRDGPEPDAWPYQDALVDGGEGIKVPGVVAVLDPVWMTRSLVAGPQEPADRQSRKYDAYFARQFKWAAPLPVNDPIAFLFDRASSLFKQYVRTGNPDYLRAAIASHRLYMGRLVRDAEPDSPRCGGGWSFDAVNPCDVKFVYIEPILLSLALTGDDTLHDDALIEKMARQWDLGGWSGVRGAYRKLDQHFTERNAGLGLVALTSAYELTGEQRYLDSVRKRVGWLSDHQANNPDGLPAEGCWRHSWQIHEGNDYDPDTDIRGCSPWMSENIIDGLWHAWHVTHDERIPDMITGFGQWLERHGWIDTVALKAEGYDWRNPCSGPDGQIVWYFGSSQVPQARLIEVQESEGWYSDAHTVQMALPVAAARYFERDPERAKALDERLDRIENSYAVACAASSATPRRFNWNHRGSGVVPWLRQNAPSVDRR
jgi:hypothetical protein